MNLAQRRWMKKQAEAGNYNALRGYRKTGSQALTNNSAALTAWDSTDGIFLILSAVNTTDSNTIVRKLPDGYDSIDKSGANAYYQSSATNQWWTVEGLNFILKDGGTTTGDTIRLEFIKGPVTLVQGGASEVLVIPTTYYDELLTLAIAAANEEENRLSTHQVAQIKEAGVNQEIANSGNLIGK